MSHGHKSREVEHVIRHNRVAQVEAPELPKYASMVENGLVADISICHLEKVEGAVVGFLGSDEVHIAVDHLVGIRVERELVDTVNDEFIPCSKEDQPFSFSALDSFVHRIVNPSVCLRVKVNLLGGKALDDVERSISREVVHDENFQAEGTGRFEDAGEGFFQQFA